jgi:transposase-like protein
MGEISLDIPRDRKGDFEPQIVKKNQTDISNIEDQVLSMYAKECPQEISQLICTVFME